jgi:hypothetical protein
MQKGADLKQNLWPRMNAKEREQAEISNDSDRNALMCKLTTQDIQQQVRALLYGR